MSTTIVCIPARRWAKWRNALPRLLPSGRAGRRWLVSRGRDEQQAGVAAWAASQTGGLWAEVGGQLGEQHLAAASRDLPELIELVAHQGDLLQPRAASGVGIAEPGCPARCRHGVFATLASVSHEEGNDEDGNKMLVISTLPGVLAPQQALGHPSEGQVAMVIMVTTPGRAGRGRP